MILAIDPSLTATGWVRCEFEHGELIVHAKGCIRTKPSAKKLRLRKGDDDHRRIGVIWRELRAAAKGCSAIASEQPAGFAKGARAARAVAMSLAVVSCLGQADGREVLWFQPAEAKRAATGKATASKAEVRDAAVAHTPTLLAGLTAEPEREAVADALSVAMAWAGDLGWTRETAAEGGAR